MAGFLPTSDRKKCKEKLTRSVVCKKRFPQNNGHFSLLRDEISIELGESVSGLQLQFLRARSQKPYCIDSINKLECFSVRRAITSIMRRT